MRCSIPKTHLWLALALTMVMSATAFAQTSASLSGEVQDAQGKVIPGAKITATEPSRSQSFDTVTSEEGTFTFPTLQPGTYTVTVEAQGFKQLVKSGIVVNVADRQTAGDLILEPGDVSTTVEVVADGTELLVKTESGEQSDIITGKQVRDLALNGRNYLDLMKIIPGVSSRVNGQVAGPGGFGDFNINGTRANQHNLTIDGSTNVDTGSNGTQHVALNLDTIAEFKVLTSNYQAEYGRSAGGDIKVLTRGGGSELHGTGYLFHRHEQFNANTFINNASGNRLNGTQNNPRNFYRYNYFGYNVGGPIAVPRFGEGGPMYSKLQNRFFFFFAQEFQKQLVPQTARQIRVPTAAELTGDFSNSRDNSGALITIRDPETGQPFPGNRIPASRFNQSGLAILRLFNQFENSPGTYPQNYFNHNSQQSISYPRRQETIRIDYNITDNTRMFGRYTQDSDQQVMPYGLGWTSGQNFPLTPTIFQQPAKNASLNITSTLSPTMTNEFIFGPSQNKLSLDPQDPNAGTYSGIGFNFQTPFPYPSSQFFNIEMQGIAGIDNANISRINAYDRFPYRNSNTTFDFIDNVSKVWGTHTLKAGIYVQRSRKDQAAGGSARIIFSNDTNNPGNAGYPFANALLGNFTSYQQPTRGIYQGQYRSTNVEWFVQDNWKASPRLTLDYGVRFAWIQPQYDSRDQDAYFVPGSWNQAQAVRLYRPANSGGTLAFDPANPSVNNLPGYLIGRIVPGSGNPFNGIQTVANGYTRGGLNNRAPQIGPAVGFAYDVFGDQKTVLRGGYRLGFDRVSGNNLIFPAAEMPPSFVNPVFNFGNLNTVGLNTGQLALGTSGILGADPDAKLPNVQSFSLQVQQEIGFSTLLSVAYVGTLSHHLTQLRNLNYVPYFATFQRENQDPSKFAGGVVPLEEPDLPQVYRDAGFKFSGRNALTAQFLRRYPGYNDIGYRENVGSSNYHSMQVTLERRFTGNFAGGLAYTWSKVMGTANGDGDFSHPTDTRGYDYRRLDFDRTHILAINYIWNVPKISRWVGENWFTRAALDNWELSGISQFSTGQPIDIGVGIQDVNLNQRITGSWTEGPRARFFNDPQPGKEREAFFDYTAFRLPGVGEVAPFPRSYVERPGQNVTDFSVFKRFPLWDADGGQRYLQFRLELFNAFNHAQFNDFNRGITWNIASDFSNFTQRQVASSAYVRNLRLNDNGPNRISSRLGNALGEVNSQPGFNSSNRVIQMAVKLYF